MEPKKLRFQKFKNLKRKHLFRAFLTCLIIGLIISVAVLASVKNEKIIYKDKPVSVSQTNALEIKNLTQVIAKAQEDKALLEAQQKPENNAKIKALTTLIAQLQTTKKTIEDNAQDIERFRLKIKRLEEEKSALNTQLEAAKQDKSNSARISELETKIALKDEEIAHEKNENKKLEEVKNALEDEKANTPAIFQELKELKELHKQWRENLNKHEALLAEARSKIPGYKKGQAIPNSPEIEAASKAFQKAGDEFKLLKPKIIQAIKENKY